MPASHSLQVGDTWRAVISCSFISQISQSKFDFLVTGVAGGSALDTDFATTFESAVAILFKDVMANGASYDFVTAYRLAPYTNRLPVIIQAASSGAGTAGADAMSPQTAGLLVFNMDLPGHRGKGRTYLPFPSTADSGTTGQNTTTYRTRANAIGTALRTLTTVSGSGGNATISFGITKQVSMPHIRPIIYDIDMVTDSSTNTRWATQKRRSFYGEGD